MAHMTPVGAPGDYAGLGSGAEESMQSFIQHHILQVLEPVQESIRDLQQQMQHVTKDLAMTDSKVEEHESGLNKVDRDLLDIRTTHGKINSWMTKAQVEMAKEAEARAKAEREHDATRLAVAKGSERHQHCMAAVEGLDRKLGALDGGFQALKGNVVDAERNIQFHAGNLAALKDSHDDLAVRHVTAAGRLDRAHELAEMVERDFHKLAKSHTREMEENALVLNDMNEYMKQLQEKLDATSDRAEKQGVELRQTTTHVHSLKVAMDHKDGYSRRLDSMQARDEEMLTALKKHVEDLERLQRKVDGMSMDPLGSEKQAGGGSSELVDELRLKLECVETDVGKLGRIQSAHVNHIKESLAALERLQRDQGRLREHADATEQELVDLRASHKQAAGKLDQHALEQQRLQSDLRNVSREVDAGIQQIKGDLGSTSKTLSKLRSHHDACNQNMFGLAKGFQDAGRHVVGSPRAPLPALEARTPRGPARMLNDTMPKNVLPM